MVIIYDKRLPDEYVKAIGCKCADAGLVPFGVTKMASKENVYSSILHHPDIYLFKLDHNTYINAPGICEDLCENLKNRGMHLIEGKEDPGGEYPRTSVYNAVRVGNFVFSNFKYVDREISKQCEWRKLKKIQVKQGYARCSSVPVGEEAIITSDEGIAKAALRENLDVLKVSSKKIILPGQKHGFIGGAAGIMPGGDIMWVGDIESHPEAEKINRFLGKYEKKSIYLKGLPLYDAGSLFIV